MTRRCEQAALAFLFAGVLAMLACALWARFTQPSIVKRLPAQAQQQMLRADVIIMGFRCPLNGPSQDILHLAGQHFLRPGDLDRSFIRFHCGIDLPDPVGCHIQILKDFR